jgi:WD40 repeat protein
MIGMLDASTGEVVAGSFTGPIGELITSEAFSPDGQCIASCSEDGVIRMWNVTTGEAAILFLLFSNPLCA